MKQEKLRLSLGVTFDSKQYDWPYDWPSAGCFFAPLHNHNLFWFLTGQQPSWRCDG
jgi:hypothetical protein